MSELYFSTNPDTDPGGNQRALSYYLTPAQIAFFDTNGYLILRNWITGELLASLQKAATNWIKMGLVADQTDPDYSDFLFAPRSGGKVMYRVNYLHSKGEEASLQLLGSPHLLAIAESLCGPDFVPTYESMVFKQAGDGETIEWHQDTVHSRQHRIFNFDLYLDPSTKDGGALRVIPGSQKQIQDTSKLREDQNWNVPGAVEVEMEAGDVLLHDVMLVHGSPGVIGGNLRRTLYYEFRAAADLIENGPWDKSWVERRLRLIPVGLEHYKKAFPQKKQFEWQISARYHPQALPQEQVELKIMH